MFDWGVLFALLVLTYDLLSTYIRLSYRGKYYSRMEIK